MPHGFFTLEQFKPARRGGKSRWVAVAHFNMGRTLTNAVDHIAQLNQPGFYRVIQTQRMIRAENENGRLHLHCLHAGSPETLNRSAKAFARDQRKVPSKPNKR